MTGDYLVAGEQTRKLVRNIEESIIYYLPMILQSRAFIIKILKICVENHTMTVSNIRSLAVPRISPSNFCYVRDLDSIFAEI